MSATSNFIDTYVAARQKSAASYRRASAVLGGNVGHDLRYFDPIPLYIERGLGGRKWDVDGNEYIDFLMGNGALLLGHAHPSVIDAIVSVASRGTHFGNDHLLQIEWAELIQKLVPSAERVRFVNSGTEASQLAIRLARAFTGRNKLLRFEGHFHGWHDEVVHGFQLPFQADGSRGVPPSVRDNLITIPDGNMALVETRLSQDPEIAAVILEPSGASYGRVPIDIEFLRQLRTVTTKRNVLLIFDEVVTGFRFSPGGAQGLYDITPDLSYFAKVVAGGLPGGAVVGQRDIMSLFDHTGKSEKDRFERVTHFGTFNASPLSAAAGIAVLGQVASGEPTSRADAMASQLRASLNEVLSRHQIAGYAYGPSSTFHVYFETNPERLKRVSDREDLKTSDARLLKGMPGALITQYQRLLRFHGVDIMSSTGGLLSAAHSETDLGEATVAFEKTITALLDEKLIYRL